MLLLSAMSRTVKGDATLNRETPAFQTATLAQIRDSRLAFCPVKESEELYFS